MEFNFDLDLFWGMNNSGLFVDIYFVSIEDFKSLSIIE
jgi:hypothetical protein